jgi:hypothetical protein
MPDQGLQQLDDPTASIVGQTTYNQATGQELVLFSTHKCRTGIKLIKKMK